MNSLLMTRLTQGTLGKSLLVCAWLLLLFSYAHAQNTSNKGKDFWLGYAAHIDGTNSQMSLYITAQYATSGTVSIPGKNYSVNYSVQPNKVTVVDVPSLTAYVGTTETIEAKGIHITAQEPVVVYAHIYSANRSGATLVLPTETLGREYYTIGYEQRTNNQYAQFMVVAVEDNTLVQITPTATTRSGKSANVPFTVTLQKGQVYQVQANSDLTGSKVESISTGGASCKKIAVFSGSSFTPLGCNNANSGDNLYQQLYPVSAWGQNFVTAPFKTRNGGDLFRVVAGTDNTAITLNGVLVATINKGQYHEFQTATANYISASNPVILAQYPRTQGCDNVTGDPEMIILSPVEQNLNDITLYSSPYYRITGHYINILMKTADVGTFKLDGQAVQFTPVASNPTYSYAQQTVTAGNHTLKADSGFNAVAYGFGNVESYGYSAGANIKNLNHYITFSSNTNCQGATVGLKGFTDYTPESWKWYFGDGTTSTQQAPSHQYNTPGTYMVSLVTTKNNGNDCDSKDSTAVELIIYPNPKANFSTQKLCIGENTQFQDASTTSYNGNEIISWAWDFGDRTTSTLQNPTHQYAATGTYTVTLKVTTAIGCTNTTTQQVKISPLPQAAFENPTGCVATNLTFTDKSTVAEGTIQSWRWDFGDGSTSTAKNPAHQFQTSGSFQVKLMVTTSAGCVSEITKPVTVQPLPEPLFDANPVCPGTAMEFFDRTASPVQSWLWEFGDGTTATIKNPTHVYQNTGTYSVTLTVTATTGCVNKVTKSVTVHPKPAPAFAAPAVCLGGSTTFTDQTTLTSGTVQSWFWDFGDGSTSTLQNPTHQYAAAGTYNVLLRATSSLGCVNQITKVVKVNALPVANFQAANGCHGAAMAFTDLSTVTDGSINSWRWEFGDGQISSVKNPSHTYSNPGIYSVTLTVGSSLNCIQKVTRQVTVHPLPVPQFEAQPVCFGAPMAFTDLSSISSGTVQSWLWDFGDGTSSTAKSPSHTYSAAGVFSVKLKVTSALGCSAEITRQVKVHPLPRPVFQATSVCVGTSTAFTDNSTITEGSIQSWLWEFGDGSTSTLQNPTHLYATAGTYNVSLKVTSAFGCISQVTQSVKVDQLPVSNFKAEAVCVSGSMSFQDLSTVADGTVTAWRWDFGDGGTSTVKNPSHKYSTPGTYTVILTTTSSLGCESQFSKQVTVHPLPSPAFSAQPVCVSEQMTFKDLSSMAAGTIQSWFWNFGDGTTSTSQNPTHQYTTAGLYSVKLTVTSALGCTAEITQQVKIHPLPAPAFEAAAVCFGVTTTFINTSSVSEGSIQSWFWDFGDGASSTQQHPTHIYQASGTYTVTLRATTAVGCVKQITQSVKVHPLPTPDFRAEAVCVSGPMAFQDLSTVSEGSIQSWLWNFGDGATATTKNPSHQYQNAGSYTVTLTVTSSQGCSRLIAKDVVVHPLPTPAFVALPVCLNQNTVFQDQSTVSAGTVQAWLWDFGDGTISTQQNPSHKYNAAGEYSVKLTVTSSLGCSQFVVQKVKVHPLPQVNFEALAVCLSSEMAFKDLSTIAEGTVNGWHWNFGDGATSTLQNPTHRYANAGIFTVTLTATSVQGCTSVNTKSVKVHPLPVPAFEAAPVCLGKQTTFVNKSTIAEGNLVAWTWDFGDGTTSSLQNPVHTFSRSGTFTVSLKAQSQQGCVETVTQQVVVYPKPIIQVQLPDICLRDEALFINNTTIESGTMSYHWFFGDGTTSTEAQPRHKYVSEGVYDVKLVVTSDKGCQDSLLVKYTVSGADPVPAFTFTDLCQKDGVKFIDASSIAFGNIVKWEWDFGDGTTSTEQHPVHVYQNPGTYTVRLTASSGIICKNSVTQTLTILPSPTAVFSTANVCEGESATFQNTSTMPDGTAITYAWDFGDGNTSDLPQPTHLYTSPGTYTITLTVTAANGCQDRMTQAITVHPTPKADFSPTVGCLANAVNFRDMSSLSGGQLVKWEWDFGNGATSLVANPVYQYPAPGTYVVRLKVTTDKGCTHTISKEIIITPTPVAQAGADQLVCGQTQTSLTANAPEPAVGTWTVLQGTGGTFSDAASPTATFTGTMGGTYLLRWTVHNSPCTDAFDEVELKFRPTPQVEAGNPITIVQGETVTLSGSGEGTLLWYPSEGLSSTSIAQPTASPSETTKYYLLATSADNCTALDSVVVTVLKHLQIPKAFSPNNDGTNDTWVIEGMQDYPRVTVEIFNRWGEKVYSSVGYPTPWDGKRNGHDLPVGAYYYIINPQNDRPKFSGSVTILR